MVCFWELENRWEEGAGSKRKSLVSWKVDEGSGGSSFRSLALFWVISDSASVFLLLDYKLSLKEEEKTVFQILQAEITLLFWSSVSLALPLEQGAAQVAELDWTNTAWCWAGPS